jgi:hypothetical protein
MPSPKRGKQHKRQDDAPFEDFDEVNSPLTLTKVPKNPLFFSSSSSQNPVLSFAQ